MPRGYEAGDAGTEFVYGTHAVRHALNASPESALELCVQEGKRGTAALIPLVERAVRLGLPVRDLSRRDLDLRTGFGRHQGVALLRKALAPAVRGLDSLLLRGGAPLLLLVLDGVQDPHNLGACIRSADAAGADAVIIPKDRAVPVNATVRKVASGAAEHTPVISVTNLARALRQLKSAGVWVIGLAKDAREDLYGVDFSLPTAFVLGAEGSGLRHNIRAHCDRLVALPMAGAVESLNVSVAAGICLYEALRQRRR
ncbi:MAG: 23S rRNA (guanosine(2251)-2'-O)-methyltransferase RlmB [Gammaproteobacteria bacterium]|nr:23S rRNA (guanosine(2251)-2'-O)-methyltransferase RlmB [Gammaproteobacteria bacterium]